jgi:hypothetical protein
MTRPFTEHEQQNLSILKEFITDVAFLYLTSTGLSKSILDAVLPVRTLLHTQKIHDFNSQAQGSENKVIKHVALLNDKNIDEVDATLYRPQTKKGDPRIWFSHLNKRAKPNDILALFVFNGVFYTLNLTQSRLAEMRNQGIETETTQHLAQLVRQSGAAAQELIARLRDIACSGPLRAVCMGDTSIGRTVEAALGIPINSSKTPDYHGIELKSARAKSSTRLSENRSVLFAQVPDWRISKFKSSRELLDAFGYGCTDGAQRLYCTVNAGHPNAQGLQLNLLRDLETLAEAHIPSHQKEVVVWQLDTLHARLNEKHHETFWISADSAKRGNQEFFTLKSIRHTRNPSTAQFDNLLETGKISVDHLIKRSLNGRVTEKGPLFKLHKSDIPSLFLAATKEYTL